ncbi:MAG: NAD-binding protein, partial [Bacteroidota bacterium]
QEIAMAFPDHTFRIMAIVRGIRTILPRGHDVLQYNDQVFVLARPKDMPHVARLMGKQDARMHHIMILGGSQVGAKVAMQLAQVKHNNVKLVEPDRERAKELADQIPNVLVIHGDATDIDLLVLEGLGEMDAFVAVTHEEESNLVTCLMAKHLGVRKTVALLSKGAYIPISQAIGLDAAVSTKLAVSREIMRFLRGNHVLSVATVHGMDAEILEIEVEARAPATRGPLRDLSLPKGTLIGAVMHGRTVEVATGQTEIHPGDRVILFALPRCIEAAERYFDRA